MMNASTARMLTRYNAWADRKIYDAVAALPQGEAEKVRVSLDKSMIHTLHHIYIIDAIWQGHLEGRDHGFTSRRAADNLQLSELWPKQKQIDDWFVDWSDKVTDKEMNEEVQFTLIGGNKGVMKRGEILLHLVVHKGYHRGFACDMFYQVPSLTPQTDLPVYLREAGANA